MAKSDGTVYIDTKMNTSGIGKGVEETKQKISTVTNAVKKFGDSVKKAFTEAPTGNAGRSYKEVEKDIKKAEAQLDKLIEKQIRFVEIGGNRESQTFAGMEYDIEMARNKLFELQEELSKTSKKAPKSMNVLKKGVDNTTKSIKKMGNTAGSAFLSLMKLAGNSVNKGLKKLDVLFKKLVSSLFKVEKNAEKSGYSMKKMLASSLMFSAVFSAINTITTSINDGLVALAENSDVLNNTLSSLKSNLLQLRNSFIAAFSPIIQVVIPYIETFISYLNKALNYAAQLVAALLGQDTYKKALEVSASFIEVEESAKDAQKALQGYLSPLDEINRFNSKDIEVPNIEGSGAENLFEDVQVESRFNDLAEKIKNIFAGLFAPLKEAWDEVGQFVMDSWLFALNEAWKLIKDIGTDFLDVWNQAETVDIFKDILKIVGDIGLTIGILLENLRAAWNYADTGKRILEAMRDIIGVITDNILHAADATVEWAKGIDFTPLLSKIQELMSSLVPVFDSISGILTDFYENVILPLGEWVLEEGLPDLLQVFIDFNNEVDWDSLRKRLNEFWKALEPFAETVGSGLIEFIDRISDNLAEFVNSGEFEDFLTTIEDWMANVSPDDVADGLENLAKSLITLKIAVLGFSAVSTALTVFEKLSTVFMGLGKAIEYLKGIQLIPFLTSLFSVMNPGMIGEIGIKISDLLTGSFLDPREWDNWFGELYTTVYDGINNFIDTVIGPAILDVFNAIGQIITDTFNWDATMSLFEDAKANFKEGGLNIILGVIEGILGAIGLVVEPIGDFFSGMWNAFCETFGINSPAEEMKPIGEFILLGVIEGMKLVFDRIKETIDEIKEIFSTKLEEIASTVSEKFSDIKDNIFEKISEIKSDWDSKWDEFADKVTSVWDNIKISISSAVDEIKDWISDIIDKFNEAKEKLSSLSSGSSKKSSFLSGISSIHIPSFNSVSIPKLASGSVIPPNAPFMAVLGDQKHGTNIEAPLDTIKQGVREVIGNGNNGTLHAHLYIGGKEVLDAVIDMAKLEQTATGVNPLLLT